MVVSKYRINLYYSMQGLLFRIFSSSYMYSRFDSRNDFQAHFLCESYIINSGDIDKQTDTGYYTKPCKSVEWNFFTKSIPQGC